MIISAVAFSKKLQTSTNAFVTSLGVADLLTSITLIWNIVGSLGTEWLIPEANWICQFTNFMIYACIGTSVWTLSMIGINRLIHILKPIWYKKIFTSWKLVILVLIPWVIPEAGLIIVLATGNVAYEFDKESFACTENNKTFVYDLLLNTVFLLPLLAIVGSYICIYVYVKNTFGNRNKVRGLQSQNRTILPTVIADCRRKQISKQEIVITKNLFIVVVGFFVCFVPYFTILALPNSNTILHIRYYATLGPYANSAINFIIYAIKHPDFKVVPRHMMRCSYADIPQPSPILKYLLSRRN
ncbi:LOW QUALITY PROTEIN: beta-2 adrenergic receptor-like [Amphiura filiformis]|uniref:LOW QUALITY PROTEIN: beta-2 adrenergic receptor-like n=1 Tax=Amphiura filiformis TaxID=82378 RepID=UPI003B222D0E